jgi:chromosome condensin MukBEF ATPase and DNA-binding subunit MukB
MDHDEVREALNAQINALVTARANSQDQGEKDAATNAIEELENEIDLLDGIATDELVAKVDAIIERLDEIVEENNLDAASALGRSFRKLRDLTQDPTAGGD